MRKRMVGERGIPEAVHVWGICTHQSMNRLLLNF
jgi:hypothetical protein